MKKFSISIIVASTMVLASCSTNGTLIEDKATNTDVNTGIIDTDPPIPDVCFFYPQDFAPSFYDFRDKTMRSTVSLNGQNALLTMVNQLKVKLNDPATSVAVLNRMFKEGKGFSNSKEVSDVDGSVKKLRETVASAKFSIYGSQSQELLRKKMDGWITSFTEIDKTRIAVDGASGKVTNTDGVKFAFVTAEGFEINQVMSKTLIGSVCLDQAVNEYISKAGLDKDLKNVVLDKNYLIVLEKGENYTSIQHHWDEAYGCVFGTENHREVLLGKYLRNLESSSKFRRFTSRVKGEFIYGRMTSSDGESYAEHMHSYAETIREYLSTVVAVNFVRSLASVVKEEPRDRLHGLSEAYGFAHALYFVHVNGKQLDTKTVDPIIEAMNNLWKLTPAKAIELQKIVTNLFDFTVEDIGGEIVVK